MFCTQQRLFLSYVLRTQQFFVANLCNPLAMLFMFLRFISAAADMKPGQRRLYSDTLRTGRSLNRIPVEISLPVQTVPGVQSASCTMGTRSVSRGVAMNSHPTQRRLQHNKSTGIPPFPFWTYMVCSTQGSRYRTLLQSFTQSSIIFPYTSVVIVNVVNFLKLIQTTL